MKQILSLITLVLFSILTSAMFAAAGVPSELSLGAGALTFIGSLSLPSNHVSFALQALVNLKKPNKASPGAGVSQRSILYIFDWDEVNDCPNRDAGGARISGNIAFNPNKYMAEIYFTANSLKYDNNSEGDPDTQGFIQQLMFNHPGNEVEKLEFENNFLNRNIGIIIQPSCDDSTIRFLYGEKCAPLQMVVKNVGEAGFTRSEYTFKSTNRGSTAAKYEGTLTLESPKAVIPVNTTTINLASGEGRYQVTNGHSSAVVLAAFSNPVHNGVYTLVGASGANPLSIPNNISNVFVKDGTSWSAIAGAEITFKAFKSGASSFIFVEQSRA